MATSRTAYRAPSGITELMSRKVRSQSSGPNSRTISAIPTFRRISSPMARCHSVLYARSAPSAASRPAIFPVRMATWSPPSWNALVVPIAPPATATFAAVGDSIGRVEEMG